MVKRKNKIVVIGSNSFSAGFVINDLLKKKFKVLGISRSHLNNKKFTYFQPTDKNFKFYKIDINKDYKKLFSIIKKSKPNYIINFSAQSMVGESWSNPLDWFQTNTIGLIRLYNFIFHNIKLKRLIHISTPEVYGSVKNRIVENKNYKPNSPYAASRVSADQYLEILNKNFGFDYCSIRASNVFGETQKLYRIIPKTIYSILKNKKIYLHGGGYSKRNFIHMENVSKAILKCLYDGKAGEIYHVSGDKTLSIRDLVKKICKIMNYDFNKLVMPSEERKGKDQEYSLSNNKIKKYFKWKEKVSLDEGLIRTIKWLKINLNYFNINDESYRHKK